MTTKFREYAVVRLWVLGLAVGLVAACSESTTTEDPVAPAAAPVLERVSPESVPNDAATPTTLTATGRNFAPGAVVSFVSPAGQRTQADTQRVSSSSLTAPFAAGSTVGTWMVDVTNPDGQRSGARPVSVVLGTPTISGVFPNPVPQSSVPQVVTVTGSNFAADMSLQVTDANGNVQAAQLDTQNVSVGQFSATLPSTPSLGTWTVQVTNAAGMASQAASFTVGLPRTVTKIQPGPNATLDALQAIDAARPGSTIEFDCGYFDLSSTLLISNVEDIQIKGCGMDETVLSFRNTTTAEGFLADNVEGLVIEDLTVADTGGNAFELRSVNHGTLRRVRAFWSSGGGQSSPDPISADNFQDGRLNVACTTPPTLDPAVPENQGRPESMSPDYTPSLNAGRYGIYPVRSNNILVEFSESFGASDAGIYVGQTSTAIIRDSIARYNVFGFEIENVQGGEYARNLAECNTGGFLIYDLDGNLTQYGERSRMYDNISRKNNTYNFTEGGFVALVPPGSGMITLAYDLIDIFDNQFIDNNTAGIIHTSYEILGGASENRIDGYTEGLHIFDNYFSNNGNDLPNATTEDLQNENVESLLPALVGLKTQAACNQEPPAAAGGRCPDDERGGYRGAHIVWDGLVDPYDEDCPYPTVTDAPDSEPVPSHPNGKPAHTNEHYNPPCHYNAYKFDLSGPHLSDPPPTATRKGPEFWFSCIDTSNTFEPNSVVFSNFKGTKGANAAIAVSGGNPPTPEQVQELEDFPADLDLAPHDCPTRYGANLPPLDPIVIPPFVPSGNVDEEPTPEEIAALCEADVADGEVNYAAAAVNCPRLDQYNLFADPEDPTSTPNGRGVPYSLNSKLFSDYSVKYRVAYLPPDTTAVYQDSGDGSAPNASISFPTGTIIAKTFSFLDEGVETAVETRLLIRRENSRGTARWAPVPYVWTEDGEGNRIATLLRTGATAEVSWNYRDVDSNALHVGSTDVYSIPTANQCNSCHVNEDGDAGAAPIGTKVRFMNKPFYSESPTMTDQSTHPAAGVNQLAYWCANGLLAGCPEDLGVDASQYAANVERAPRYNVPGDSGAAAGSDADVEARARAWLEVNCQHCHNVRGFASNSGYYLDSFRTVDVSYGICKRVTAAGAEGTDGRLVDIHPGDASRSILEFRIGPTATASGARMPPIARSVVDVEGHALVRDWINNVVVADNERYPGSESCAP